MTKPLGFVRPPGCTCRRANQVCPACADVPRTPVQKAPTTDNTLSKSASLIAAAVQRWTPNWPVIQERLRKLNLPHVTKEDLGNVMVGDQALETRRTSVQFPGESTWDALVNHRSMDVEEEEAFLQYCLEDNIPPVEKESSAEILLETYHRWLQILAGE